MRLSNLYTKTIKDNPSDEQALNAQLLIRAGFIHKEMSGVYSYLPLGKRVLDNISEIIKKEMNELGCLEVQMSSLQPKDIWEITGRWDDKKVDNWFKTKLYNGQLLGIGLTHEEPVIDSLKSYVDSYKNLPIYVYQIQTKFRNELRAKSGLLRGREFLMKDLYSFSLNEREHEIFYNKVIKSYNKIYSKLGLGDITYRTYADGGIFSKTFSDEFQTLSVAGEDRIYVDEANKIAINDEIYNDQNLKKLSLDKKRLVLKKGVEVGNIFSLGSKYTDQLGLYYNDQAGHKQSIIMGCYGIGVSRLMGVIAEVFADDRGLNWPTTIAPFKVYLISINENPKSKEKTEVIYNLLTRKNIDVLYDDRDMRAGQKFADADLLGIPYRVVVNQDFEDKQVELKRRNKDKIEYVQYDRLESIIS
jgi:prolyl-tRNA synthetase